MRLNAFSLRVISSCVLLAGILAAAAPAEAQLFGGRFGQRFGDRLGQRLRQPAEEVVAVSGSPFGVGRMTVQLPASGAGAVGGSLLDPPTLTLAEKNGRAIYSAAANTPVRQVLRELLNRPQTATVYFLFTGDEPLDLTLYGPSGTSQRVSPRADPEQHRRLLAEWWKEYTTVAARANRSNEYPHLVDVYLTSTLSRRLSLPAVEIPRRPLLAGLLGGAAPPEVDQTVGLVLGTESARLATERATLLSTGTSAEPADQPLPAPLQFPALDIPEPPADVTIEPMALHVPEECLYLRFGTFTNYRWFRSTLDPWGGDLRNLIALRGVDYGINRRVERQISLRESPLAALLGPAVIADVALIGDDPFLREGAAIGMLFQARSNAALASDILSQRSETLGREKDATDKKITLAGHEVSLLSTPDNRVRSFYATDGDFHLVTTSRRMVERFYEAGQGKRSLGQARDFRHARTVMPVGGNDSLFVYLSEAFFKQLASPHYQIEMQRRLKSITDIELAEMAGWAAKAEKQPGDTIEQLIAADLLPKDFSSRSDGSRLELHADGLATDSVRGAHGTFVPVPDVAVDGATRGELAAYDRFVQSFPTAGGSIGPLMLGVRHDPEKTGSDPHPDREHVVLNFQMTPLVPQSGKGLAGKLGPTGTQRVAPLSGDVVAIEASLSGKPLFSGAALGSVGGPLGSLAGLLGLGGQPAGGESQPYHLFAGLRNGEVALGARDSQILQREVLPEGAVPEEILPAPLGASGAAPSATPPPAPTPAPQTPTLAPGNETAAGASGNASGNAAGSAKLYFGAWPVPGLLQSLGLAGPAVPLDADGYGQAPGSSFWTRQLGQFTVASRQRDLLADVTSDMHVIDAPRPAQLWLHVGDVGDSKLVRLANTIGYLRARHVSQGNAQFLHLLTTQLGVPADRAMEVAQRLIDARLVSPVGGHYELQTRAGEFPTWAATGLPAKSQEAGAGGGLFAAMSPPAGFQTPPLDWFRGLDLDFGSTAGKLSAHAELDMQRPNLDATGSARPVERQASRPATPPPPAPESDPPPQPERELKSVLKPGRSP